MKQDMNEKDYTDELIEIKSDSVSKDGISNEPETEALGTEAGAEEAVKAEPEKETAGKEAVTEEAAETDPEEEFAEELLEMEQEEGDLSTIAEIGDSISRQVDLEIEDTLITSGVLKPEEEVLREEAPKEEKSGSGKTAAFFKNIPLWGYIVTGIALVFVVLTVWAACSASGQSFLIKLGSRYAATQVEYRPVEPVEQIDVPDEISDEEISPDVPVIEDNHSVVTPNPTDAPVPTAEPGREETVVPELKDVYNVLILGEENISEGYRGRSDLIMIASINRKSGKIGLSSVMRDCLVAIPGYADNRINAAYAIGGAALLYDTLKANLGVDIDNYVLVNFDNFESIIDTIGGVDVTLTADEAAYLNRTNYITDEANRCVQAGENHMNGDQALGYCRIRYVGTGAKEFNDFGRTSRQRTLLTELLNSVMGKSKLELLSIANKCLPYLVTDMDADTIEMYVGFLMENGLKSGVQTLRIPVDGSFSDVVVRQMMVMQINLEKNSEELHRFIYGE